MSYIPTRVIYVAAKLGLADHIRDDGASAQDLAQKLNVHPGALYRVLRTLAGLGVLHQDKNDRFFVTQFGKTLRKDSPQSVRDYAIYSHEFVYEEFGKIMDSVRTGKPVIENHFEYLRANPEQEAIFHAGMSNRGRIETVAIIEAYDFSKCGTVVDVGGGNGEHGLIMSLSPWYYVELERPIPIMAYVLGLLGAAGMGLVLVHVDRRYRPRV